MAGFVFRNKRNFSLYALNFTKISKNTQKYLSFYFKSGSGNHFNLQISRLTNNRAGDKSDINVDNINK